MSKLVYAAIASLDGYVEDGQGRFDWAEPDEEVHSFVNDLERPVGTYLYGRRMYETMLFWDTAPVDASQPPFARDFTGIWQGAEKIVYSRTLESVSSSKTRLERDFEPEAVRRLKASADLDITVGGAELRRPGDSGRARRRATPVRGAGHGRRRQAVATQRRAPRPGVAGYTSVRLRIHLRPVPVEFALSEGARSVDTGPRRLAIGRAGGGP